MVKALALSVLETNANPAPNLWSFQKLMIIAPADMMLVVQVTGKKAYIPEFTEINKSSKL